MSNVHRSILKLRPASFIRISIIKTLRYSFEHNGWINKIGLRNKGIDWAIDKYKNQYKDHWLKLVGSVDFDLVEEGDLEEEKITTNLLD